MYHKWTVSDAIVNKYPKFLLNESTFVKFYQKNMLNKKKLHDKRFLLKSKVSH